MLGYRREVAARATRCSGDEAFLYYSFAVTDLVLE
jgi:hypothetical protein